MADKVLIIRNSALGDVAMTLPVLYSVARKYQTTEFYLLTRPFFAKIFINRPNNLHIIEADYKTKYRGARGLLALVSELRTYRFKAVADFHNVLRSWVIDAAMCMCGAKVAMVNKKRSSRLAASSRADQQSFIERYADTLARIGYPIDLDFKSVFDSAPAHATEILHPAVGIAPSARYANKTYPFDLMEQVVSNLTSQGINVYLYGARGAEQQMLEAWASKYPRCISLAGKMEITDEIATMAHLDVMVSMDSANQHLASLASTPVISIWGSTAPSCGFYAYRQDPELAVCSGVNCQPCTVAGSKTCKRGDLLCLKSIPPEQISDKVLRLLSNK